jgi:hypothetical protein
MSTNNHLSIFTQLPDRQQVGEGIHLTPDYVIGTHNEPGLLAIAKSQSAIDDSAAEKAIEILLDDMEVNLSATQTGLGRAKPDSFVKQCVQESIDNINEYLHFQLVKNQLSAQDTHTSLALIQFFEGHFGYVVMGGFSCLLLRQGELKSLGLASDSSCSLGEKATFEKLAESIPAEPGDILVMAQKRDIHAIGMDYLRTTLSRFPDAIDTALRQINTRMAQNKTAYTPGIVLARVDSQVIKKRGWMDKLRNR